MGADKLKRNFLAVYDYGMGGVWMFVRAETREEVEREFPELTVVSERPAWITDQEEKRIAETATYDLETDRTFGLLAELRDLRDGGD